MMSCSLVYEKQNLINYSIFWINVEYRKKKTCSEQKQELISEFVSSAVPEQEH